MLTARYGADVIKVEPLAGDWARGISTRYVDHPAFSVPANLGKRGIALDVKTQEGAACLQVVRTIANGTTREKVNDHLEYLDHPQVKPTGLISWIEQPGIGRAPTPAPGKKGVTH